MRRGITLIEILVVIAIAAIVMAIATPAFVAARRSGQATSSLEIMRQLHLGTKLYQMDHGGDGRYGDLPEMGLFSARSTEAMASVSPTHSIFLASPCGLNRSWFNEPGTLVFHYVYRPGIGGPNFAQISTRYRENMLLWYDVNCDEPGTPVYNPYVQHFGIGLLLSGQAVRKRAKGRMDFDDAWWTRPPDD